jgi:putative nucleotidyltransferase with HDIG domain
MKLNSSKARNLLEIERQKAKDDRWIEHCLCVGDSAGKIAKALNEKGYNVDIDKTITLGYLHDVGKYNGESHGHVMRGYSYLKDKGYDEEYCNICLTHSYLNNDIICTAGGVPNPEDNPFLTEFIKNHEYTIEEKLINICDLMCLQGGKVYTIDKRLIDIMIRRGAYSNTQYHIKETYKLKEYFDNLLGYNLYDLFPEIKENL